MTHRNDPMYSTVTLIVLKCLIEADGSMLSEHEIGQSKSGADFQQVVRKGLPALLCIVENTDGAMQKSPGGMY